MYVKRKIIKVGVNLFMNKKRMNQCIGLLFVLAACFFAVGTMNHILFTKESVVSSLLLFFGCSCGAVVFFKKK